MWGKSGLLLVFFLVNVMGVFSQGFGGVWTDSSTAIGITTICCDRDPYVFCQYSQFGLQFGYLLSDGVTFRGRFIEGGLNSEYDPSYCRTGDVEVTVSADGSFWSGFYTCDGQPGKFPYKESRIPGTTLAPQAEECAALDILPDQNLNGVWNSERDLYHEAICIAETYYYYYYYYYYYFYNFLPLVTSVYANSYTYDISTPAFGFDSGTSFANIVLSGYFIECDTLGTTLQFLLEDGRKGEFWWTVDNSTAAPLPEYFYDPYNHGYIISERSQNEAPGCIRFQDIEGLCATPESPPPPPPSKPTLIVIVSAASSVAFNLFFITFLAGVLCAAFL